MWLSLWWGLLELRLTPLVGCRVTLLHESNVTAADKIDGQRAPGDAARVD